MLMAYGKTIISAPYYTTEDIKECHDKYSDPCEIYYLYILFNKAIFIRLPFKIQHAAYLTILHRLQVHVYLCKVKLFHC